MNPSVCCVMLTADRHELASKAVACFLRQSYPNKALLIYDTGLVPLTVVAPGVAHACAKAWDGNNVKVPIGALRNNANGMVNADVICHWDDDDWSHPDRLAEQVGMLYVTGAQVVGYDRMLFDLKGEAWMYANDQPHDRHALGTSLCYWRQTFCLKQFKDNENTGEDATWLDGLTLRTGPAFSENQPRMIARIHGANTGKYERLDECDQWVRVPEWDARVKEILP